MVMVMVMVMAMAIRWEWGRGNREGMHVRWVWLGLEGQRGCAVCHNSIA